MKFISVKRLRNGGIVYKVNSDGAADWMREAEVMKVFVNSYVSDTFPRPPGYLVLVENVPTYFDPSNIVGKERIASTNDVAASNILEARWLKPIAQRKEGQRTAHAIFKMRS